MTTAAPAWQAPTAPQTHSPSATVVESPTVEPAMPAVVSLASREVRGWRARVYADATPPREIPTEVDGDKLAAGHARPGHPDPNARELWDAPAQAGNPGHVREDQQPAPELLANTPAGANVVTPAPAPVRPRAGFTGEDNTREAKGWRWLFLRPFDQWAAEHPGSLDKLPSAGPLASRPPTFVEAVSGAVPAPGGGFSAPGMTPVGGERNSVRLLPRAWDAAVVNDGAGQQDATAARSSSARARGWRL